MIWREKKILLALLAIVLLANIAFFFTYRVQYQSRLDALDERQQEAQTQLDRARLERAKTEGTYQSYRKVEQDVQQVFDNEWSTKEERLTLMIAEVKRLAVASGLEPSSYGFDRTASSDATTRGSQQRSLGAVGAEEVGVSFGVQGTYDQVRRLINLLELSRQFVIVDRIGLTEAAEGKLGLSLHIKTLFRDDDSSGNVAKKRL